MCFIELNFLYLLGEEDGNREAGESEMDGQGEKTRHAAVGPDEWDGPSKDKFSYHFPRKPLRAIRQNYCN